MKEKKYELVYDVEDLDMVGVNYDTVHRLYEIKKDGTKILIKEGKGKYNND